MSTRLLKFIKKYKIPKLNKLERLSSGANGNIWNIGNEKLLKFGKGKTKENINNAEREYTITKYVGETKKLNFVPHIHGQFYGNGTNGSLFILNKVPGVTLHEFSQTATPEQLETIREKLLDYVKALKGIHVIHGDLNPNNIMIYVSPNGDIKVTLIDFGRGRYNTNKLYGNTLLHPWPTKLGCKPGNNSRYCKLTYGYTRRLQQPSGLSNKNFVNAMFGKRGGVVSKATRLQNAMKIINSKQEALNLAGKNKIILKKNKKGTILKMTRLNGQRETLRKLLLSFKGGNENERILKFVTRLNKKKNIENKNKNVKTFIDMLQLIKNAKNIPLFTPTTLQKQKIEKIYTVSKGKQLFNQLISKNILEKTNITKLSNENRKLVENYTSSIMNINVNEKNRNKFFSIQQALFNTNHYFNQTQTPTSINKALENARIMRENLESRLQKVPTPPKSLNKPLKRKLTPLKSPPMIPKRTPFNNNNKWRNLLGERHVR